MLNFNQLQHYKGYETFVKKLDEAKNCYEKYNGTSCFDFYGVDKIEVVTSFLSDKVPYKIIGGYEDAIYRRVVVGDNILEEEYVSCLNAKFNEKFVTITHQDVTGALYHLGIDREKFGDLWVEENNIYLYCVKELEQEVIQQFTKVKNQTIQFQKCDFKQQTFKFQEMKLNVSSLRIDKVVSAIIHHSREKAKELIDNSYVNVNNKTIEQTTFVCNNNDILSIRMFGRYKIEKINQNPKSGNYILVIQKFI